MSAQAPDLKDSVVAKLVDERHAAWEADLPLGDDAALAVMGEELAGSDPLGGNARAEFAGEDPALAGRNIDHLVDFVAVEERIEKMPPRTTDVLQNPIVRVVGGEDRVGLQVPPPAVDHHEESAGRYLDPLHLPLPEQLRHAEPRRCHHQPDDCPSNGHVRPPLRGLSVSTGPVRRRRAAGSCGPRGPDGPLPHAAPCRRPR